jgi:ribosomal protein S18 acetylase RimI-like enzyme
MKIAEDLWLAAIIGHDVFKISLDEAEVVRGEGADPVWEQMAEHVRRQTRGSYYAKIDTTRIDAVKRMGALGFYVVDVNVTFGLDKQDAPPRVLPKPGSRCRIGEALADQQGEVLAIAGSCFRFSRFHLDPLIPLAIANQIKHDWILNYFLKQRGERLWVATVDGRAAGFLAVIAGNDTGKRYHAIDLIGVAQAYQGQGVGQALTAFFIDHYREQSDFLLVGTQVANLPSIRLYEKCGFSLIKSAYVMHLHLSQAGNP